MILGEVDPVKENQAGPQGTDSHYKPHSVRKGRETAGILHTAVVEMHLHWDGGLKITNMDRLVFCGQKESACTHSPLADDCDRKWR